MHTFFSPQGSSQSDKVNVAELHVYHGAKLYVSYLAQGCSVNMTQVMTDDSGKVKKMTAGRAKAYALVNMVLHLFAVETVLQFQQMLQIKEIGFLFRLMFAFSQLREACVFSILDFYEDAFEDSQSLQDQLCRVIYAGGCHVKTHETVNTSVSYGTDNSVYQNLQSEENNDIIAVHCPDRILHHNVVLNMHSW